MSPSGPDVEEAWRRLRALVGDQPSPRFFNAKRVLAAEEDGLPVMDGMLGRLLETQPTRERGALTLQICAEIADRVVAAEVESRCHNLHGALLLMLDSAGIPSVTAWGSVYAETDDPPGGFVLNAELPAENENHRPGHSWIITPEFSVIDLALTYQGQVGGSYASTKAAIPPIVHLSDRRRDPIPREWYPNQQGSPISDDAYANATKYFDVLGWSEFSGANFKIRYLPGAVQVPAEDLHDIDLHIGGLRPDYAFERSVLPVIDGK